MTLFKLIILQFCAHLLADYIFQPQSWSDKKEQGVFTFHHFYHVLTVFGFSWLLSFDVDFWFAAYLIAIVHLFTDMLKSYLRICNLKRVYKYEQQGIVLKRKHYFFIDQFIHLLSLSLITYAYSRFYGIRFLFEIPLKPLAVITAFIFCAKPANIIIQFIFIYFGIKVPEAQTEKGSEYAMMRDETLPNAGKLIGVMERYIALSLIIIGQFSAVGLIIAAKSILRFRNMQRNEYILVGTLLSFGISVLIGIVLLKFF